jgi:hypothetical protein
MPRRVGVCRSVLPSGGRRSVRTGCCRSVCRRLDSARCGSIPTGRILLSRVRPKLWLYCVREVRSSLSRGESGLCGLGCEDGFRVASRSTDHAFVRLGELSAHPAQSIPPRQLQAGNSATRDSGRYGRSTVGDAAMKA